MSEKRRETRIERGEKGRERKERGREGEDRTVVKGGRISMREEVVLI
jgi:hypothetical protein